ncbi:GNAT family N-acetyltransferase [Streptomyces sp. ME02-8801-2C]|uniref:GNAT family N-acetyltransferase n=1 Tax=Streptomyces sp. ME02-8801-2C TaxID=3028680 RepID=UPI0029B98338|nr:GNAT family N-acetyltransferase [Streptomyces sp. ME02-8801-2C]MDX3455153.1 GNAT family N-acetyltransferase [Streptomyces sp. ME02-8801-2C]
MTTTLRPIEPLQRETDGALSRRYQVCVNSRPVGAIHLGTDPTFGDQVAKILDLRIDERDRRRGRGTVAALAAEEVARGWGCRRVEASVPDDAPAALRLATALCYVLRNRRMDKVLGATPPELPAGSRGRPMTETEFEVWEAAGRQSYAESWIARGVPTAEAHAKAKRDHELLLPRGVASEGVTLTVLEHEGDRVGILWLGSREGLAFVYKVETEPAHRGRGHGRALMLLAEAQAIAAGRAAISLNVFAGNSPAERLYESLGYETVTHHMYKDLL